MRERMRKIGGTLVIHSVSGGGTEVVMKLQRGTARAFALRREAEEGL
jgi:nitrate/nitrite-specific signal transduction histidine kinase